MSETKEKKPKTLDELFEKQYHEVKEDKKKHAKKKKIPDK